MAAPEECGELLLADSEGLIARCTERRLAAKIAELEPPKAPRIDKAQFTAAFKEELRMRMRRDGTFR